MTAGSSQEQRYLRYRDRMQQIADIRYASAVLNWDEETYLPEQGASFRGRQLATLASLAHERFCDPELGRVLESLQEAEELSPLQKRNVQLSLEDYQKNRKYPSELVKALSQAASSSYHAWIQARKENDFSVYLPELERMVALKRQEAAVLGYQVHPYDALLDEHEKGMRVAVLDQVFGQLRAHLKPMLQAIAGRPQPEDAFLNRFYGRDQQWAFGLRLLKAMGFDFRKGRQDLSEHPFTTSFNPSDVRITTRIDEHDLANMIWSCIHEGGHALYEQGLPEGEYGLPCGEACSLGIHESQSRLWENCLGRSLPFWEHFYEPLQKLFPENLKSVSLNAFYGAVNRVQASLIRTEADELSYHFHVMIRYELEKDLLAGALEASELKDAWNAKYAEYLGVRVPDDKHGILQDIHWCHGSFGYFPTYSLGSLYAAQFYEAMLRAHPELHLQVQKGMLAPVLDWLRREVHPFGRFYTSQQLCENVCGEGLNAEAFLRYARTKYGALYGIRF